MRLILSKSGLRTVLIACAVAAGLLMNLAPASSSVFAVRTGWLQLAHLSPNTPAVDVYLYSIGNPQAKVVLHHVSYGTVSPYLPTPAGTYTVEMRAAGAAATSAPVISTAVKIHAGDAYTVAGMGPFHGLRLEVLRDDLKAPAGDSMVRVIQASMREHLVTVSTKSHLFGRNLAFASATGFQPLAHGDYSVRAKGQTEAAADRIDLQSGSIHTLVILDTPRRLKIVDLTDAVGSKVLPGTAPATGFGGTAPVPGPSMLPWAAIISAGLLLIGFGLVSLRRSRRQYPGAR